MKGPDSVRLICLYVEMAQLKDLKYKRVIKNNSLSGDWLEQSVTVY